MKYYEILKKEDVMRELNRNNGGHLDELVYAIASVMGVNTNDIYAYNEFKNTYHVYLTSDVDYYLTYINKGLFK